MARIADKICELFGVLNILQHDPVEYINNVKSDALKQNGLSAADIDAYISERATAKQNKDWTTADKIRAELLAQGIVLKDGINGTTWDVNI